MWLDLIFFLVTFCYILLLYASWNDNYWLKCKIPFIEPERFFGNVKDVVFMRRSIGQVYQDIYRKLGDKPLGGFFKLRQPILMVKHPDLIRQVLVKRFACFHSNDIHLRRDTDPILKMNPFFASGATWRSMRSMWAPVSNDDTLAKIMESIKSHCREMVDYISKNNSDVIEGKSLSSKFISDVIANCSLGVEVNSFKQPDSEFQDRSSKVIRRSIRSNLALIFAIYAPSLAHWFKVRILSNRTTNYFISLVSDQCRKRVKLDEKKNDFLQDLIDVNAESEKKGEGTEINYNKIMGHCMSLFFSGYFKAVDILYFSIYDIYRHPHVLNKLREEIKSAGISQLEDINYENITKMNYLEMILSEELRLRPSIQVITRICTAPTSLEFDEFDFNIDQGVPVTVPVYALHMDPDYYPEPTRFDPERFTAEAVASRPDYVYLPFGAGPRCCPGQKFGKILLKSALVSLVLSFDVTTEIENIEQDTFSSIIYSAKGTVPFFFKPIAQTA